MTNAKPAKSTQFQEQLIPTIELLALARQYPSKEISGLVDETITYVKTFSLNGVESYERELLRTQEIKPTLLWPSAESKDIRMPSESWLSFLIYLYAKDLKKQLSGADLSDAKVEQVSEPKATAMPSPKFKGRSVDEWLALLQVEQSAEGQSDAFVGVTGLFNEADSPRILTATLENLRSKRGVGDDKAVAKKLENGFALLRLCAGEGYGKLLTDELTTAEHDWAIRIISKLCVREGQWLPEHDFLLKWLVDPEHTSEVPVSAFLYGILADRKLPQSILETCFEVARKRYGDDFFLSQPIGDPKTGYSIMTPRIIDLAIAILENQESEPNRVALAASLLAELTSSIGVDKIEPLAECIEKRLVGLAKDKNFTNRLTAVNNFIEYENVHVWSNGDWQLRSILRLPRFAKNSEAMVLLSLIYHLGSPISSKLAIQEVIHATADERVWCNEVLKDKTISNGLSLIWPCGKEQLEKQSDEIKKLSPEIWRAASINALARLIRESIENRMANEAQTQDPGVLAQLPQAYRDFAKWNHFGLGDMSVSAIKGLEGQVHQRKRGIWFTKQNP